MHLSCLVDVDEMRISNVDNVRIFKNQWESTREVVDNKKNSSFLLVIQQLLSSMLIFVYVKFRSYCDQSYLVKFLLFFFVIVHLNRLLNLRQRTPTDRRLIRTEEAKLKPYSNEKRRRLKFRETE